MAQLTEKFTGLELRVSEVETKTLQHDTQVSTLHAQVKILQAFPEVMLACNHLHISTRILKGPACLVVAKMEERILVCLHSDNLQHKTSKMTFAQRPYTAQYNLVRLHKGLCCEVRR